MPGRQKQTMRLPLEGNIDLTYRCNNACRHCWLWLPADASPQEELSLAEIRAIVDQARAMGCRKWGISGGEPMLRPDFDDIFDYITCKALSYTLNTNGTLISPEIARLLKRRGTALVSLYGGTAQTHDHVTRRAGSFEAALRGMRYLQEAGARFAVQLVPMRANYHEWPQMLALAESLSPVKVTIGAEWLHCSADGCEARNREIRAQRLDPQEVVRLSPPAVAWNRYEQENAPPPHPQPGRESRDDRLFRACIATRREFHIDPYGQMSFCAFVKDPALRYDLRQGSFQQAWEEFIPSLSDVVRGGAEYLEHCRSCELRVECRWCAVYAYLEHRRYSAPIKYLCQIAAETRRYKERWAQEHRRYYQLAGVTIRVEADLPITDATFAQKFEKFRVAGPGEDTVYLHHRFHLPDLDGIDLGTEVYSKAPWTIYRASQSWLDFCLSDWEGKREILRLAEFDDDHTHGRIYHASGIDEAFKDGGIRSLSLFPTDQIWLARVLADRGACYLHASGMALNGRGLVFVGRSGAGKSTVIKMLQERAEVLCDDRVIVRRWPEGFRVHGTWSHGEIPTVSSASAPLHAILVLEKSKTNRLVRIHDPIERTRALLDFVVRPLVTPDWWQKILGLATELTREVPIYRMQFDKSGQIVPALEEL